MDGVKVLVFVVWSFVHGSLPGRIVDGATVVHDTSKLFASCLKSQNTAIVRFFQLYYPESQEQYTRYVPSDAQLSANDPAWITATGTNISTFLECASYAEKQSAMIFKYEGSLCSISNLRLSMLAPKCGDRTAQAYFVKTSCKEPSVSAVTFAAEPEALVVSWTLADPCSLSQKYRVSWTSGSIDTLDGSVKSHRITGLPGCHTESVIVVALNSSGVPFGKSMTMANTTDILEPTMTNLTATATVDSVTASWTARDDCNLISGFVVSYDGVPEPAFPNTTIINTKTGLQSCHNVSVVVHAIYNPSNTTTSLSQTIRTLNRAPELTGLMLTSTVDSVTASWTKYDVCEMIEHFDVIYNGVKISSIANTTASNVSTGLTACQLVVVEIYAIYAGGSSSNVLSQNITAQETDPILAQDGVTVSTNGGFSVSWTTDDPCNKISDYEITWDGAGSQIVNKDARNYTISAYLCVATTFTVQARNSSFTAIGNPLTGTGIPIPASPVISNVVPTSSAFGTVSVTWTLINPCWPANAQVVQFSSDGGVIDYLTMNETATAVNYNINSCNNFMVTVTLQDSSGNNMTSSNSSTAIHPACASGFVDVCTGCLALTNTKQSVINSKTKCRRLDSQAKLFNVNSAAELARFRTYMTSKYGALTESYWVDLTAVGTVWTWGGGYVQPSIDSNSDWNSGEPKTVYFCATVVASKSYRLDTHTCSLGYLAICYY